MTVTGAKYTIRMQKHLTSRYLRTIIDHITGRTAEDTTTNGNALSTTPIRPTLCALAISTRLALQELHGPRREEGFGCRKRKSFCDNVYVDEQECRRYGKVACIYIDRTGLIANRTFAVRSGSSRRDLNGQVRQRF